jgi:hypothetical protein
VETLNTPLILQLSGAFLQEGEVHFFIEVKITLNNYRKRNKIMSIYLSVISLVYFGIFVWLIFSTLVDITEQLKEQNGFLKELVRERNNN